MDFQTWDPVYDGLLAAFGYPRDGDEQARDRLGELVADGELYDPADLALDGKTVAIAGAGPSLESEAGRAAGADAVLAASTAVDRLQDRGVAVDAMVTDLDKNPETGRALTESGTPVFVHAHGDNVPAVETHVPTYDHAFVVPTTQAAPTDRVYNFGGFTDGDRAAFTADHLGADELAFVGWDFEDPTVAPEKREKLRWAERLLYWLERRRGERFDVLDGRRADLSLPAGAD